MDSNVKLTMAITKGRDGWYIGQIEEIPGVLTQGKTIAEAKENLMDALELYLEVQREEREQELKGQEIIREELVFA